ncbi:uncharacterized protein LOC135843273 [Planococcus citri]|uniref:uncharacterized protein LOC135839483 n=1 Tax=Planococcus citri TaxID=170843 RepID=UPI0031F76ACF
MFTNSFYSFPENDDRRAQWAQILGIDFDRVFPNDRLCSMHFRSQDIKPAKTSKNRTKLKHNCTPISFSGNINEDESEIPMSDVEFAAENINTAGDSDYNENVTVISNVLDSSTNTNTPIIDVEFAGEAMNTDGDFSENEQQLSNSSLNNANDGNEATSYVSNSDSEPTTNNVELGAGSATPQTPRTTERPIRQRYLGDFLSPHMKSPRVARRFFYLAKEESRRHKKKIHALRRQNLYLKKKIKNMEDLLDHLKKSDYISEAAYHHLLSTVPENVRTLVDACLTSKKPLKYDENIRQFAVTLYFYSTKGYAFVRKAWKNMLPAESTIQAWLRVVNGEPGFTQEAFDALKNRSDHIKAPLPVNLVIDEMSIRQRVGMGNDGVVFGAVNLGSNMVIDADTEDIPKAKNALVFMVVSLKTKFKVPVGYFLIDGMTGKERAHLLNMCLEMLHDANTHVMSVTFDGAYVNFTMCEELGANFKHGTPQFKPYFPHPVTKKPVYVYPDPSHNIKNIRNAFAEYGPLKNNKGEDICWKFVPLLYQLQTASGLHFGNKIRKKHIDFSNTKMKVKLATQVLSESVHDSLEHLKSEGFEEFQGSSPTAEFCKKFDETFDLLNCREKNNFKNKFCKPLKTEINDENLITKKSKAEELKQYIISLKTSQGTSVMTCSRKTGFLGLVICLENLFKIYEALKTLPDHKQDYLLSFKLSQDHLENFFSAVRRKNGWNNNPDALQFKGAYRQLLVRHEIESSNRANCEKDDVPILSASSRRKKKKITPCNETPAVLPSREPAVVQLSHELAIAGPSRDPAVAGPSHKPANTSLLEFDTSDDELAAYTSDADMNDYSSDISDHEENELVTVYQDFEDEIDSRIVKAVKIIVPHIAGFVIKSILNKNDCGNCNLSLVNKNPSPNTLTSRKSKGRLVHPSENVMQLCLSTEIAFRNNVNGIFKMSFDESVKQTALMQYFNIGCDNNDHCNKLKNNIVNKYVTLRKHHEFEQINDDSSTSVRQKFTKLILFKNQ